MIRRAGCSAEAEDLVLQKVVHAIVGQQRRRPLKQERLVGRTAALGYKQELVSVFAFFIDVDLSRQIVLGVLFLEHRKWGKLRITQVLLVIGIKNAGTKRICVAAFRPDATAFLAHYDSSASILTHRQNTTSGNIGVLQKILSDEAVIIGCFGIFHNIGKLLQMAGA